jgi:hypothetical protein
MFFCKDSASREKYKMKLFIFISEAPPIFAFCKVRENSYELQEKVDEIIGKNLYKHSIPLDIIETP